MPPLHGFLFGPGLGRDEWTTKAVCEMLSLVQQKQHVVVDADALWIFSSIENENYIYNLAETR